MDEKDKVTFETTLAVESAKQTAELGKDVASDIIRPTSKSIGENIGKLTEGVFGWLGVWGEKQKIKQKENLNKFRENIASNINKIPDENLKEPTMYIVGPAIETSKYYFEEDYFRNMFAKLIAGACDNRLSDIISPYFVDAIKQMNQQDALVLSSFKDNDPQATVNYKYKLKNSNSSLYCYKYVFYLGNPYETPETNASSIVNLERLGFISIDYMHYISDDTDYQRYSNDPFFISIKKSINDSFRKNPNVLYDDLILEKGLITLTPLGRNFINICL